MSQDVTTDVSSLLRGLEPHVRKEGLISVLEAEFCESSSGSGLKQKWGQLRARDKDALEL
jgi:hypothetical protein